MDEQVINDLYSRARFNGYKKSKEEFVNLLHSDNEVFKDNYNYVKSNGYQKSEEDFASIVGKGGGFWSGLKKKATSLFSSNEEENKPKKPQAKEKPVSQSTSVKPASSSDSSTKEPKKVAVRAQEKPKKNVEFENMLNNFINEQGGSPIAGAPTKQKFGPIDAKKQQKEALKKRNEAVKEIFSESKIKDKSGKEIKYNPLTQKPVINKLTGQISIVNNVDLKKGKLTQPYFDFKKNQEKEVENLKKHDYKYDDPRFKNISSDEQSKTLSFFKDVDKLGVDVSDFSRYLKNETNFFEDENVKNYLGEDGFNTGDIARMFDKYGKSFLSSTFPGMNLVDLGKVKLNDEEKKELLVNKYLSKYLNDRVGFLKNKSNVIEDDNKKAELAQEESKLKNSYNDYKTKYLPNYKAQEDALLLRQKEKHEEKKKGGIPNAGIVLNDMRMKFNDGFFGAVDSLTNSALDIFGADAAADYQRLGKEADLFVNQMNYTTNGTGKVVDYEGNKYYVESNGNIVDADTKTSITNFEDSNKINEIYNLAKKSNKTESWYSPEGYLVSGSEVLGNLTAQILATRGLGAATGAAGLTAANVGRLATVAPEMASVFGMVGSSTYEDTLQQLRDAGISDSEAKAEAMKVSALTSLVSAGTTYFLPNANANKILGGLNSKLLIKESIDVLKKEGSEGLTNFLKQKGTKILLNTPEMIGEGLGESVQELLESGSQYMINEEANRDVNKKILQTEFKDGEILDTFILSASAGALMGGLGKAKEGAFGMNIQENFNHLSEIDPTKLDEIGSKMIKKGEISQEQFDELKTQTNNYRRNRTKILSTIKGRDAVELTQLIAQRDELKQQKSEKDEAFHPEFDEKIAEVNSKIDAIVNKKQTSIDDLNLQDLLNIDDDQSITFTVKNESDVPEEFKDRAEKRNDLDVESREKVLGLPIGKKTTEKIGEGYTYTLTGQEIKEYALNKQKAEAGIKEEKPSITTKEKEDLTARKEELQSSLDEHEKLLASGEEGTLDNVEEVKSELEDINNKLENSVVLETPSISETEELETKRKELQDKIDEHYSNIEEGGEGTLDNIEDVENELKNVDDKLEEIEIFGESRPITKAEEGISVIEEPISETHEESDVAPGIKLVRTKGETKKLSAAKNKVLNVAKKAMSAVGKLVPDLKIVLHENDDSYLKSTNGRAGRGEFNPETNTIHINVNKQNATTIAHEIFHAVLLNRVKTDAKAAKAAANLMKSIRKSLDANSELAKKIDEFAKMYQEDGEGIMNEERLAQLVGILSSEYKSLNKFSKNKVVEFFKRLAEKFGIDLGSDFGETDKSVIDFLNRFSESLRTGKEISESEVDSVISSVKEKPKAKNRKQKEEAEKNFEKWKGNNVEVSGREIQDVKTGEPIVAKAYHGTTNEFYVFDSSVKGSVEGHLGRVNYFTSDYQDAAQNYLSEGADLTTRIENLADRIGSDLQYLSKEDILNEYNITSEEYEKYINESEADLAILVAERELRGDKEQVLEVYVKLNNPIVLGDNSTWFDAIEIDEDYIDEAASEIAEEYDITEEEARNDYDYDVRQRAIEKQGESNKVLEALEQALKENGYDYSLASDIIGDDYYEEQIDLNKLEKQIRRAELYENKEGEMASYQVISDLFKRLGFDGIILTNVSDRFENMNLPSSTSHIHVFDEFNNQIKLADGTNVTFNENTSDIRQQKTEEEQLSDKVKKARDRGFSDKRIANILASRGFSPEKIKEALGNVAPPTVSEQEVPGRDALMSKVDQMIERQRKRGVDEKKIKSNVDKLIRDSEVYNNADDKQKASLELDGRNKLGVEERRAPSIGRILGALKDLANITRQDKNAIVRNIRQLSKSAANKLSAEIRMLVKSGNITTSQAATIITRLNKVNVLNEKSISSFVDYMEKIFKDAEYAAKVNKAVKTMKSIKSSIGDVRKDVNLRELAKEFVKIDPSMVDDIDAYNDMADRLKSAIAGSKIIKGELKEAAVVNIKDAMGYISNALDAQEKKIAEQIQREIEAAKANEKKAEEESEEGEEGEDIEEKPKKKTKEEAESETMAALKEMHEAYKSIILSTIDEDGDISESKKELIKKFLEMDISKMNAKEAAAYIDSIKNFMVNRSTALMQDTVSRYEQRQKAKELADKGYVTKMLRKYFSGTLGRLLANYGYQDTLLFERMFNGAHRGSYARKAFGWTDYVNSVARAKNIMKSITTDYVLKFYKTKPNGLSFNDAYNDIERGIVAEFMKTPYDAPEKIKEEFDRKKNLINESIESLRKGNKTEKALAEVYQKVYDKIVDGSENADDIINKADKTNLDAVDYWIKQYEGRYEKFADISESIYNIKLGKENSYTPTRFRSLENEVIPVDIGEDDTAFNYNSGNIYTEEAGSLKKALRPSELPNGKFLDLSFDSKNISAMKDLIMDNETAIDVRRVKAFLESDDIKRIIPYASDRKLLQGRFELAVQNVRNKGVYAKDPDVRRTVKFLNKLSRIGAAQTLGAMRQIPIQTLPIIPNTMINTGGKIDLAYFLDKDKINFLNNVGYGISNRGAESLAMIDSIDKMIDKIENAPSNDIADFVGKAREKWMKYLLENPDVYIARASWLSYYEKSLKKQGIPTKNIDYATHKVNEKAAEYAESMVSRQQNASIPEFQGKFFSGRNASSNIVWKMLMAFSNFRMNQSARIGTDYAILTSKSSTRQDKRTAAASLVGAGAERLSYGVLSTFIGTYLKHVARQLLGRDDDEETYEEALKKAIRYQSMGAFLDFFSPVPFLDTPINYVIEKTGNFVQDIAGIEDEDRFEIPPVYDSNFMKNAGMFGIIADRATDLVQTINMALGGKYRDKYGNAKELSEEDQKTLRWMLLPELLSDFGLAPAEGHIIAKNVATEAQKKYETPEEKAKKEEREAERQANKDQKLSALNVLLSKSPDENYYREVNKQIDYINAEGEEKEAFKQEKEADDEWKDKLLIDPQTGIKYDNESALERYNKPLYDRNFGPNSEWYRYHFYEDKVKDDMHKLIRNIEDSEYGFTPSESTSKGMGLGSSKKPKFGL